MKTNQTQAEKLAHKLLNREISPEEEAEFTEWYNHNQNEPVHIPEEFVASESEHRQRILNTVYRRANLKPAVKLWPQHAPNWIRGIAGIAAAVAIIVFGVWFYTTRLDANRHPDASLSSRVSRDLNDIAPGHNGATLTLTGGKIIELSDKKKGVIIGAALKYDDGEILRDALDDKEGKNDGLSSRGHEGSIAATTAKGQTYTFTLQDGTKVWLNADSKLEFLSNYKNSTQRIVKLTGEGYFEVAKDKTRPFIVESEGQQITVLGTHFNVSVYKGEGIKTTLLEGSVKIDPHRPSPSSPQRGEGLHGVTLKPNQQSLLTNSNITVKQVNAEDAISWRSGTFTFNNEPLAEVMQKIARWYKVSVSYTDEKLKTQNVYGSISRFSDIADVIHLLELTGTIKIKTEQSKIIISKK